MDVLVVPQDAPHVREEDQLNVKVVLQDIIYQVVIPVLDVLQDVLHVQLRQAVHLAIVAIMYQDHHAQLAIRIA